MAISNRQLRFGGGGTTGYDTTTTEGLYQLANASGFGKEAQKILKTQGEKPKEIFSGGFISDIFDVLNTLQYGVVGVMKGKGFTEGVRTRQSFSDKDALGDNGIPGVIAGIALDILVDPLTYIPPLAIAKRVPGLAKAGKAVKAGFKASKTGQWLGRKFVYQFGADPVYKMLDERRIRGIAKAEENIKKVFKPFANMTKEAQGNLMRRAADGSLERIPLKELADTLDPKTYKQVENIWKLTDNVGEEATKVNLLEKGTWEANKGTYIPNLYRKYEEPAGLLEKAKGALKGTIGIKGKRLKARALKQADITEAGYPLLKGAVELVRDVENARFFNRVAKNYASDVFTEGMAKNALPTGKRLGELAGKYVPEWMHEILTEMVAIKTPAQRALNKGIAGFKYGKVVLNPATHGRNVISNTILNWWKLGIGPWRVDKYLGAVKEMATNSKSFQAFQELGGGLETMAAREIDDLLFSAEGTNALKKLGKGWRKVAQYPSKLYQGEEVLAKFTAFKEMVRKGMTNEDALKAAYSATFNYAQVTPFVRKLRENIFGFPFITFTVKATPVAVETALKHPGRISVFGKIKNSIENAADIKETERERKTEPAWVRDGFYIKLPIKDKNGRSAYFDLTYIIPFGDIVSGGFFERGTRRETQLPESRVVSLLSKSPSLNFIKEISRNEDFYGNKIWRESDTSERQFGDLFRHLVRTYSPPAVGDMLPGGYTKSGERRPTAFNRSIKASPENTYRTIGQELARNVGIKIQPISADIQENYFKYNSRKALETLLVENGVLKEFNRTYIPK